MVLLWGGGIARAAHDSWSYSHQEVLVRTYHRLWVSMACRLCQRFICKQLTDGINRGEWKTDMPWLLLWQAVINLGQLSSVKDSEPRNRGAFPAKSLAVIQGLLNLRGIAIVGQTIPPRVALKLLFEKFINLQWWHFLP